METEAIGPSYRRLADTVRRWPGRRAPRPVEGLPRWRDSISQPTPEMARTAAGASRAMSMKNRFWLSIRLAFAHPPVRAPDPSPRPAGGEREGPAAKPWEGE